MQPHDRIVHFEQFSRIIARLFDLAQVDLIDIAGNVLAVEHRAIEMGDLRVAFTHRLDQTVLGVGLGLQRLGEARDG